jgi:hypothetical protein
MNIRPGVVYIQAKNRDQKRKVYAKSHEKPPKHANTRSNREVYANECDMKGNRKDITCYPSTYSTPTNLPALAHYYSVCLPDVRLAFAYCDQAQATACLYHLPAFARSHCRCVMLAARFRIQRQSSV